MRSEMVTLRAHRVRQAFLYPTNRSRYVGMRQPHLGPLVLLMCLSRSSVAAEPRVVWPVFGMTEGDGESGDMIFVDQNGDVWRSDFWEDPPTPPPHRERSLLPEELGMLRAAIAKLPPSTLVACLPVVDAEASRRTLFAADGVQFTEWSLCNSTTPSPYTALVKQLDRVQVDPLWSDLVDEIFATDGPAAHHSWEIGITHVRGPCAREFLIDDERWLWTREGCVLRWAAIQRVRRLTRPEMRRVLRASAAALQERAAPCDAQTSDYLMRERVWMFRTLPKGVTTNVCGEYQLGEPPWPASGLVGVIETAARPDEAPP